MNKTKREASFWKVRFTTKDGMYHSVWWGVKGGPYISRTHINALANSYLTKEADWLAGIDEIEPVHSRSKRGKGVK